jgi:hypothetical protein
MSWVTKIPFAAMLATATIGFADCAPAEQPAAGDLVSLPMVAQAYYYTPSADHVDVTAGIMNRADTRYLPAVDITALPMVERAYYGTSGPETGGAANRTFGRIVTQQLSAADLGPLPMVEQTYYYTQLAEQVDTNANIPSAPGVAPMIVGPLPAPTGGVVCEYSGARACEINSYWDITGGRSPTDYVCRWGYGPNWCNTWNARVEWLIWFSRGREAPPLASATTAAGSTTDYPRDPIGTNARNGARFTLGYLLPQTATWLEGRFWGVENGSETVAISSGGMPILSQPVLNVTTGLRTNLIAAPGFASGNIRVLSRNSLFGADVWLRRIGWDDGYHRFAVLAGYQFTRMDDSMLIQRSSTLVPGNPIGPAGLTATFQDTFRTQNEFHGASLGLVSGIRKNALSLEVLGKVGLGDLRESVIVSGSRTTTAPSAASVTRSVGFLTQPSNEGTRTHNVFAAVPELNLNGIVHFSPQWQALVGYSFIYWSDSVLAGKQIDPRVNLTQVPGPTVGSAVPTRLFNRSDFFVQGLNLGAEYRW